MTGTEVYVMEIEARLSNVPSLKNGYPQLHFSISKKRILTFLPTYLANCRIKRNIKNSLSKKGHDKIKKIIQKQKRKEMNAKSSYFKSKRSRKEKTKRKESSLEEINLSKEDTDDCDYENYVTMSRKWRSRSSGAKEAKPHDRDDEEEENGVSSFAWLKIKLPLKQHSNKDASSPKNAVNYDDSLLLEEEQNEMDKKNEHENNFQMEEQSHYKAPKLALNPSLFRSNFTIDEEDNLCNDIEQAISHKSSSVKKERICNIKQYRSPNTRKKRNFFQINHSTPKIKLQTIQRTCPIENQINATNSTLNRSIFYTRAPNGRIQFRRPIDKIHLLIDSSLEPGTLFLHSPQQGGGKLPLLVTNPTEDAFSFHACNYVFVVQDDLYQNIVKEISDSMWIPCGLYNCCHESNGKVHIGVAIVILIVVFLFLLVTTLIWPIE